MSARRWLALLLLAAALPRCGIARSEQSTRALFARLPANEDGQEQLLRRARQGGFNSLVLETFVNAQTLYPSGVFPQQVETRDANLWNFLARCRQQGVAVHAWIHTLYWRPMRRGTAQGHVPLLDLNPEWLDRTSEGKSSEEVEIGRQFVTPSHPEVRRRLQELCLELGEHFEVDGLVLDDVRAPRDSKRRAHFGYTAVARERFLKQHGSDPLLFKPPSPSATDREVAEWIRWTAWRENEVSTLVYELARAFREGCRRRNAQGSVAALVAPDYYRERGRSTLVQDWARWSREGYVDAVMPALSGNSRNNLQRDLDEVRYFAREAKVKLIPVFTAIKDSRRLEPERLVQFAQHNKLSDFAFVSYESLSELNAFRRLSDGSVGGEEMGNAR